MALSLETLQALVAVSPFQWVHLTKSEILTRCEAAGLILPTYFNPMPAPAHSPGIGKTVVTRALLDRVEKEDPRLAERLRTILHQGGERDGERLMFEAMERIVASERMREALSTLANAGRNDGHVEHAARRVM
ncbi:MAG: hypothetical protein EOO16_03150 [Chitinophagaceae bacterium]|nr:MAG: hypothetical protein EOO16_03150 [Chitinophagaceae bacterium]